MKYLMLKGLQCIIGRFERVAISKISDVRVVKIEKLLNQKHSDPVGDRRIVGLVYYVYSNKTYLLSTSNVVFL